jgi:hypothetical protein
MLNICTDVQHGELNHHMWWFSSGPSLSKCISMVTQLLATADSTGHNQTMPVHIICFRRDYKAIREHTASILVSHDTPCADGALAAAARGALSSHHRAQQGHKKYGRGGDT